MFIKFRLYLLIFTYLNFKISNIEPISKYKNVCTSFLFKQISKYSNHEQILQDLWDDYEQMQTIRLTDSLQNFEMTQVSNRISKLTLL